MNNLKVKIKEHKLLVVLVIVLSLIGLITYRDYGNNYDEIAEVRTAFVNYREYLNIFNIKNNKNLQDQEEKLLVFPNMKDYKYKYYGAAIQLPTILIYSLSNYKMGLNNFFFMRHLYTHFIFLISLIYFYFLCYKFIFKKNTKMSFIAVLFLVLSPRIYGDSFYNIKDLVFMSLSIINIYYIFSYLEKDRKKPIFRLALVSALTINSRVVGGIFLLFLIVYQLLVYKKRTRKDIINMIFVLITTYLLYILLTPASWLNPITFIPNAVSYFYNYVDPYSKAINGCLYFGKSIPSNNLPWHYLPVWIFITTPIIYILLFLLAIILIIRNLKATNKFLLYANTVMIFMLLFVMILRPTIYFGWRHLYFIYPVIIIDSVYALGYLYNKIANKKLLKVLLSIYLIFILSFMVINHPYQYLYFNNLVRSYAVKNFDFNNWRLTEYDAIKYILENDYRNKIKVYSYFDNLNYYLFDEDEANRIEFKTRNFDVDYVIDASGDEIKNMDKLLFKSYFTKEFKLIYEKKKFGVRLYAVYKRK